MALEPPYGVQILSHWMPLHVGLMPEWFGSINTSISIPTFHSAVIRIQGLALNSAKMGSKNSAMCRSLRTTDRRYSWFCNRGVGVERVPPPIVHGPIRKSTEALILVPPDASAERSIERKQDTKENRNG